jgi:hypothetical protein
MVSKDVRKFGGKPKKIGGREENLARKNGTCLSF